MNTASVASINVEEQNLFLTKTEQVSVAVIDTVFAALMYLVASVSYDVFDL